MRVAFITPEYVTESYFSGGLANYIHRTSSLLAARGHDVHVFTLSYAGDDDFVSDHVTVHRIQPGRTGQRLTAIFGVRLEESAESIDFMIGAYRRAAAVHRQTPIDVMQVPNYKACGLVSAMLLPVPFVVRLSSYGPDWNELSGVGRSLNRTAGEWLEWLQLRVARHVYAPSDCVRRIAGTKGHIRGISVLPPSFLIEPIEYDSAVYRTTLEGKKYLLFFGRLQLHKGFHILAQAVPQILRDNPDCHAAFVGMDSASPLGPSMREYATRICHDVIERVIFLDQTPHAQLYPIIAGAHLVILPSLIDNLPNACLEAMALGKAVLGTRGASFDELLTEGVTGFLVPPGNVEAIVEKVNEVWRRDDLDAIGDAARTKIKEFHPDHTLPRLEAMFRRTIGGKGGRADEAIEKAP
jgi:glycosyltransferase involved in cell wall biosynthesis